MDSSEKKEYEYEVAFSFLQQDEELAMKINDFLQERLNTFLYSKKQEDIAGTDGEETFNKVFGTDARIVFIIHRLGWGESPWTRIEQTAIRNRAFDEGYDFAIFAPVDKSPLPRWVPKNRLWVELDRWGVKGAAAIIEARVQEMGGRPKEETAEDRAKRLSKEVDFAREKKAILDSERGVKLASDEFKMLVDELDNAISTTEVVLKRDTPHFCRLFFVRCYLQLHWQCPYVNSLENSVLQIKLFDGRMIEEHEFHFDIDVSKKALWTEDSDRSVSTYELSKLCITLLMEHVHKTMR